MSKPPQVVLVTGPESSGKSTLARALARATDGLYVEEAARHYLHQRGGKYTEEDLSRISEIQWRREIAARASGASYVFCDTGQEVIEVWAQIKYGRCDPRITQRRRQLPYDLTLLCSPDLPWQADPLRETPDVNARWNLFGAYQQLVGPHRVIAGEDRTAQALRALKRC